MPFQAQFDNSKIRPGCQEAILAGVMLYQTLKRLQENLTDDQPHLDTDRSPLKMNRELKRFAAIVALAMFWFGSTYFAVAALFPQFALQAGLIGAMVGLVGYLFLLAIDRADGGLPLGMLITLPIVIITGGMAWWLLRLLGLWPPRTE